MRRRVGRCYIFGSRNGAIGGVWGDKVYIKIRSGQAYTLGSGLGLLVGGSIPQVLESMAGMVSVRWRLEIIILHRNAHVYYTY